VSAVEGTPPESASQEEKQAHARRNVFLTATIAGLGGLLFGYDTGVIAGALLFVEHDFHLSSFESGMVVAAVPVGAIFGALIAGGLADRYGRRRMILIAAVVFILGAVASGLAPGTVVLVIARVIIGGAIGLASAACPVYISEVAPPEFRGRLVTLFQLAVTIGILVAYLVGLALAGAKDWRLMLALGATPALVLGIGMWYMPQSPRWLVMIGEPDEARSTLRYLRGKGHEEALEDELQEIRASLTQQAGGYRELLHPVVRAALIVGVGLAILQQITGINTVIYYAPKIVQEAGIGSDSSAILASVGVGVVNVGFTVFSFWLLNRFGRRGLLMAGVGGMVIALAGLGLSFEISGSSDVKVVLAVLCLMVFVASFAISLGPIFWLLNAEIYPLRLRSKAAGIGTMANWLFNFIVSLTFLTLLVALGQSGTFFLYAGIGVLTLIFVYFLVPETKGKTLEDIEEGWRKRAGVEEPAPETP
jgi:sugar porter (SP) family MFS transporter